MQLVLSSCPMCCRIDPLQWAQRALLINEFTDGRWDRLPATGYAPGTTLGQAQLIQRNFPNQYWCARDAHAAPSCIYLHVAVQSPGFLLSAAAAPL